MSLRERKSGGGSRSGSPTKEAPRGTAASPAGDFVSDEKKPHHSLFGNEPPSGSTMEVDIAPYERFIPIAILLLALFTRFWRLTVPWGVVRFLWRLRRRPRRCRRRCLRPTPTSLSLSRLRPGVVSSHVTNTDSVHKCNSEKINVPL